MHVLYSAAVLPDGCSGFAVPIALMRPSPVPVHTLTPLGHTKVQANARQGPAFANIQFSRGWICKQCLLQGKRSVVASWSKSAKLHVPKEQLLYTERIAVGLRCRREPLGSRPVSGSSKGGQAAVDAASTKPAACMQLQAHRCVGVSSFCMHSS